MMRDHDCYTGITKVVPKMMPLDPSIPVYNAEELLRRRVGRADYEHGYLCPDCMVGRYQYDLAGRMHEADYVRSSRASMATLQAILSEQQFSNFYHYGLFACTDAEGCPVVIKLGISGNIFRKRMNGWSSYCCHSMSCRTAQQNVLEQYLAITTEHCANFWITGNLCDSRERYVA
jgi:hypothetical protein